MGNLKPGATYIYERNGDEVYAREFGRSEKTLIGYKYETPASRTTDMLENKLWCEIRQAARTNTALQGALDRAILIHHLSKDHGEK